MTIQPILINGEWQAAAANGTFRAVNPATREPIGEEYPVSTWPDVQAALDAATSAVVALRQIQPEQIAAFLEQYAANIEAHADALADLAHSETALPRDGRLRNNELPRTTGQLRQAATAARERSWSQATIDTKLNIRSMFGPLNGPVVVFGPNNFPFAFNGISGGDFAAAIAAGNPVIAKAHPGHPGTSRLFAEAARQAIQQTGLPSGMVQMLYHLSPEDGLRLVSHPLTGATGFTGSRAGGLRLKEAADRAGKPIYAEMSSVNPVYILPGALVERSDALAGEFVASCTLGAGQFCTNPGLLLLLAGEASELFTAKVAVEFETKAPGVLLTERSPQNLLDAITALTEHGAQIVTGGAAAQIAGYGFQNTLLRVAGETFLRSPDALQTEAFGAVSLFIFAKDAEELLAVTRTLEGSLTGSIYSASDASDDALYAALQPELRPRVGRLLNDKMPTGVAVSPGMNHGGPYPSTGHPGFTSVGIPASLHRFAALYSYDNVRAARLPPELTDRNPNGVMFRWIDGEWTRRDV